MIRLQDVRAQVRRAAEHDPHAYDLPAIVVDVVDEHGLVDLDTVPADQLDAIFLRHELPDPAAPDPFGSRWPGRDGHPLPRGH